MSRGTSAILITIVASAVSVGAFAKRLPPKPVAPLVADGVQCEVPHFGAFYGKEQNGGFVQAWDARKNQEEHHARLSFKDELIALLQKHGIEFDERYLLD